MGIGRWISRVDSAPRDGIPGGPFHVAAFPAMGLGHWDSAHKQSLHHSPAPWLLLLLLPDAPGPPSPEDPVTLETPAALFFRRGLTLRLHFTEENDAVGPNLYQARAPSTRQGVSVTVPLESSVLDPREGREENRKFKGRKAGQASSATSLLPGNGHCADTGIHWCEACFPERSSEARRGLLMSWEAMRQPEGRGLAPVTFLDADCDSSTFQTANKPVLSRLHVQIGVRVSAVIPDPIMMIL